MQGYSIFHYQTKDKDIEIKVKNVQWYEGAGNKPVTEPYEHPVRAGKYKLQYNPESNYYKIRVAGLKKSDRPDIDYESDIFVHPDKSSQGCLTFGRTEEAMSMEADIVKRLKQNGDVNLNVINVDARKQNKEKFFIPQKKPYPWQE